MGGRIAVNSIRATTTCPSSSSTAVGRIWYPEQFDLQVIADLKADLKQGLINSMSLLSTALHLSRPLSHLNAVPHHVDGAPDQSKPENDALRQKVVEILVQEQQQRAQQTPVQVVHLALGHVGHHQPIRHLGRDHAEGQDVVRGMGGKHLFRGLLRDNEGGHHDQAEGNDWRNDARSLQRITHRRLMGAIRLYRAGEGDCW